MSRHPAGPALTLRGPVDLGVLVTLKKGPLAWVVAHTAPPPAQKGGKEEGGDGGSGWPWVS